MINYRNNCHTFESTLTLSIPNFSFTCIKIVFFYFWGYGMFHLNFLWKFLENLSLNERNVGYTWESIEGESSSFRFLEHFNMRNQDSKSSRVRNSQISTTKKAAEWTIPHQSSLNPNLSSQKQKNEQLVRSTTESSYFKYNTWFISF